MSSTTDSFVVELYQPLYYKQSNHTLILNHNRSHIIKLEGVSHFLFSQIKSKPTIKALVAAVVETYDVSQKVAKKDVYEWLEQAKRERIIILR
jgi:hypothetical protein